MCGSFVCTILYFDVRSMYTSYCIVVDFKSPPSPKELGRIAAGIADIWKRVGLELGFFPQKLKAIEQNHPGDNDMASLDMLMAWREININVGRSVLYQAIEYCRANRGTCITNIAKHTHTHTHTQR